VTRFKELARIEAALKHRDAAELRWALGYCEMRLRLARAKVGQDYWRKLALQVRAALPQNAQSD
jgi:hypothetical protein